MSVLLLRMVRSGSSRFASLRLSLSVLQWLTMTGSLKVFDFHSLVFVVKKVAIG
jgi:hypothetical protein